MVLEVALLRSEEIAKSCDLRRLAEYLAVLKAFSATGGPAKGLLLRLGTIRSLVDFYLRRMAGELLEQGNGDEESDDENAFLR